MPKLRVHSFSVSLDGYAASPDQSRTRPLGVGGEKLHEWAFATRTFRQRFGMEGGDEGLDDRFAAASDLGIGATIMGGVATVQEYLRAGLIDEIHLAIAPVLLGQGERLFDHLDGGSVGLECVELVSSPAAVHVRLARG